MPLLWSCSDQALLEAVRGRDPSGRGLPSAHALRLLMSLLHWNPADRPTPSQACAHASAYVFPDVGLSVCIDGVFCALSLRTVGCSLLMQGRSVKGLP
jgi:hypothetical protein